MTIPRVPLFAAAAALLLPALPASAADILYEPPSDGGYTGPIDAAGTGAGGGGEAFDGLYAGAQVGGALAGSDLGSDVRSDRSLFLGAGPTGSEESRDAGLAVGGHVGADLRFGALVVGAVTDYSRVGAKSESEARFGDNGVTLHRDVESLGTTRARLGVANDRLLVYGTAGIAYGSVETRAHLRDPSGAVADTSETQSEHVFGTVVGGGADYMLRENLSVGAEYTFTDLGASDVETRFDEGSGRGFEVRDGGDDVEIHRLEGKVSLHFF